MTTITTDKHYMLPCSIICTIVYQHQYNQTAKGVQRNFYRKKTIDDLRHRNAGAAGQWANSHHQGKRKEHNAGCGRGTDNRQEDGHHRIQDRSDKVRLGASNVRRWQDKKCVHDRCAHLTYKIIFSFGSGRQAVFARTGLENSQCNGIYGNHQIRWWTLTQIHSFIPDMSRRAFCWVHITMQKYSKASSKIIQWE